MIDLAIVHGYVLTMDKRRRIIEDGAVCIDDGRIIEVGKSEDLKSLYEARRIIDAKNKAVLPGIIDTHGHPYGLIKAIGEHLETKDWIKMRHFIEFRGQTEDQFFVEGLLSSLERLKFGTTFGVTLVNRIDDSIFALKNAKAIEKVGIKGIVALGPVLDRWPKIFSKWGNKGRIDRLVNLDETLQVCKDFLGKLPKREDKKAFGWLGPSNLGSQKESENKISEYYRELNKIAKKFDVGITTHAIRGDVEQSYNKYNILGPKLLLVHCRGLTIREIEILKKTNTKVSHNPSVIAFMASSSDRGMPTWPPIFEMIDSGVTVGLGTDGPSGRITTFDMFREIKVAMMMQRLRKGSRWVMPPGKVLEMATIDAAKCIGLDAEIGSLETGKKADVTIINLYKPHLVPIYMVPYRLAYEAQGQDVDTVIVNGEIIMENRIVKTCDEEIILEQAQGEAEKLIDKCDLSPFMQLPDNFWSHSTY